MIILEPIYQQVNLLKVNLFTYVFYLDPESAQSKLLLSTRYFYFSTGGGGNK